MDSMLSTSLSLVESQDEVIVSYLFPKIRLLSWQISSSIIFNLTLESILSYRRSLKLPSQIRWNILFNILLWSLMVQPIGLPLLYHYVPSAHYYIPLDWSLYWLHAIQGGPTGFYTGH